MKRTLAVAVLLSLSALNLNAQSVVSPREARILGYIGELPYQLGDRNGCGDAEPAFGVGAAARQRVINHVGFQLGVSLLQEIPYAGCSTVPLIPLPPGTYGRREYSTDLKADPLIAPDARISLTGGTRTRWELAGGIGWALPPQRTLYSVVSGALMWGNNTKFVLGGELRNYQIPYDSTRIVVTDVDATRTVVSSGHTRERSFMVTMGASIPF